MEKAASRGRRVEVKPIGDAGRQSVRERGRGRAGPRGKDHIEDAAAADPSANWRHRCHGRDSHLTLVRDFYLDTTFCDAGHCGRKLEEISLPLRMHTIIGRLEKQINGWSDTPMEKSQVAGRLDHMKPKDLRKPQALAAIAHHEAGHAVAAFFLKLSIGRTGVSIIPDRTRQALGTSHVLSQLRERLDICVSPRTHVRIENLAVMCLAGDVAERKFYPRRHFGGQKDQHEAVELLSYISGSNEIITARLKVAALQARGLVELRWQEIAAVAAALMENKTLTADQVRQAIYLSQKARRRPSTDE
jgi:hypothetical protein